MTTPTPHDTYGEDGDFQYMNGNIGGGITIETAAPYFRVGVARSAILVSGGVAFAQRLWPAGPLSSGWMTHRVWCDNEGNVNVSTPFLALVDASGIPRIVIFNTGTNAPGPYSVYKVNAVGAQTLLGVTLSGFSIQPASPDKFDINFNYAAEGFLTLHINKSQVFTFTGDITTDGVTALGGVNLGNNTGRADSAWSEGHVSDSDTRDYSVYTCAGTAAGTLDQMTGEVSNVNQPIVNDLVFDTTTTSGAVQRYLMSGPSIGNQDVVCVTTNVRCTEGGGSLSHIALAQLIGGEAFVSAAEALPTAFVAPGVQFNQTVNPKTGVAWTSADLNAAAYEAGMQVST
jgi:hypothetical protein